MFLIVVLIWSIVLLKASDKLEELLLFVNTHELLLREAPNCF